MTGSDFDRSRIIILGAGVSGLKCAQDLVTKHGFAVDAVTVLEASGRIGGRIKTDSSLVKGISVSAGSPLTVSCALSDDRGHCSTGTPPSQDGNAQRSTDGEIIAEYMIHYGRHAK